MFELSRKVAAVTGAASGIGRAIAERFARQGAAVAILDVDESAARRAAEAIGPSATAIRCDITDAAQVADAFRRIETAQRRLDILVNNAGIVHVGTIEQTSEADFERIMNVNVKGMFLCSKAAIPLMLRGGGGVILNLASVAGLVGVADRFAYTTSKGAVLAMTRSIALDYVKQKIRCNCICPARIHTPLVDGYLAKNYADRKEEMFRQLSEYQPIGRMGTPEEVAALALYLCSDEAAFVTGQAYPIDGGVLVQ
jgi:NAD(P)-dependent dehydrogenase (short-subunit alcohol dehydrogenase family)